MFKRESEQPVRISFEEKREKRKKRSLKERLSSIPVRRRIEAVVLSVVTVMASLSIDWSSLSARAAEGNGTIASNQSISTIFFSGADNTTLQKAKISVKIPSETQEVTYKWQVYQNLKNEADPDGSGDPVGNGGSGKIYYEAGKDFVDAEVTLSDVVLLKDETAAVVFTLTSEDEGAITYKTFDTSDIHYVTNENVWCVSGSPGKCIDYTSVEGGTLTKVTLSGVPDKLALTAGAYYTLPDNNTSQNKISWTPAYLRNLTLTSSNTALIDQAVYPTFHVAENIDNGGKATVTVGGTGVNGKNVEVNVVSFELKGSPEDKSVFTYKGSKFDAGDLYTAKCGAEINPLKDYFRTTFTLMDGTPVDKLEDAGSYKMTIEGKEITDYKGLKYEKDITIEQATLTQEMFDGADAKVKNKEIQSITGAKFNSGKLVYGTDFDAEVTETTLGAEGVTYKITIKEKTGSNFKCGDPVILTATEYSGASLDSLVHHIGFESQTGTYNGTEQKPEIVFYDSKNNPIDGLTRDKDYTVKYSSTTDNTFTNEDSIINAGKYTATVSGTGIYDGSKTTPADKPYDLKPRSFTSLDELTVTLKETSFEYNTSLVINPEVTAVTYKDSGTEKQLVNGTDYDLKTGENYSKEVGTHYVTIEGCGNYWGEATAKYTVFPSLTSATIFLDGVSAGAPSADKTANWDYVCTHNVAYPYTGSAIEPVFTANVNGETLSVGSGTNDMTKSDGENNTAVSTSSNMAYFILTLPAKYASKKIKVEFEICKRPLPALSLVNGPIKRDYNYGAPITLEEGIDYDYVVKDGETPLLEDTDYKITYKDNINAGTATITATATENGNYTGTSSETFTIAPISVDDVYITIKDQQLNTSGAATPWIEVKPTVVNNLNDVVITVIDGNGNELHPFDSEDFTLSGYKNNLSAWVEDTQTDQPQANQPQVTLTGKRNLTGKKVIGFKILKATLEGFTWKLTGTSITGTLGKSGGSPVDTGYVVDYAPNLPSKYIFLYYSDGKTFNSGNYSRKVTSETVGTDIIKTITISGKGDYDGGEYKFTYVVRKKRDIKDCDFTMRGGEDGKLPTFTLKDGEKTLKAKSEGEQNPDYEVSYDEALKPGSTVGTYLPNDGGYTVTFTGIGDYYEGTRTETFYIGKPFDSAHVSVTMHGPVGTGIKDGKNVLTYFGNNDPVFVLTSETKENNTTTTTPLTSPSYTDGAYGTNTKADADFVIDSWSITNPDTRHKVGTEVTVTFKANNGGGKWYNPSGSAPVSYTYTVVPGSAATVTGYGNLAKGLSIYSEAYGTVENEKGFPTDSTASDNTISFSGFKFKYTTAPINPKIRISYEPSKVDKSTGFPDDITYAAEPVIAEFDDSNLFTTSKNRISANDTDGTTITMHPVEGGWIAAPANIKVNYTFEATSLSDATFTFNPDKYTYGDGKTVSYSVTMWNSTPLYEGEDKDYVKVGYYAYSGTIADAKTAIDAALAADSTKTIKAAADTYFNENGTTTAPTDRGTYVLVIKGTGEGLTDETKHYKGYNIAQFTIESAGIKAELKNPNFSVTYGDASKTAPEGTTKDRPNDGDLVVTGANGETLYLENEGSANDGYYIDPVATTSLSPSTNNVVWLHGTGNYEGATTSVTYTCVADIDIAPTSTPKFAANLSLDGHTTESNALELRLENDGDYPFIDDSSTPFNLTTLVLSCGTAKLDNTDLKTTVSGVDGSGDSLTTVGKKKIKIEPATGAPVIGTREYYVDVFGDISTAEISLEADRATVTGTKIPYTGKAITVTPVLTFRGEILKFGNENQDDDDYVITNGPNSYTDVKNYTMTLKGNHESAGDGNYYSGTPSIPFSIVYDLENDVEVYYKESDQTLVPLAGYSFGYTGSSIGSKIQNKIVVKFKGEEETNDKVLTQGATADYTLKFANDTDLGTNTASVTIQHTSKSIHDKTVYFSIGGSELSDATCTITLTLTDDVYDGNPKTPTVSVYHKDNRTNLVKGTDFEVYCSNNTNAGTATATITGINGRYEGTVERTFEIKRRTLTVADVFFPDVPFGGRDASGNLLPATPTITVTSGGRTLTKGTDYTITYLDPATENSASEQGDKYFTQAAGTEYKIRIDGTGNYSGTVKKTAKQLPGDLSGDNITMVQTTSIYNGKKVFDGTKPVIKNGTVELVEGENKDYVIDNPEILETILNAGTYDIKLTGRGDYAGSTGTFTYTVTPRQVVDDAKVFEVTLYPENGGSTPTTSFAWTGYPIEPLVSIQDNGISGHDGTVGDTWTNDVPYAGTMMKDFAVSYENNTNAGADKAKVILTASGNYNGRITKSFTIGEDISKATVTYDKYSADYDGQPHSPVITVTSGGKTLTEGTDYTYTWDGGTTSALTEVGSYTPVITGRPEGGYYGEKKGPEFSINAKNKNGDVYIKFITPQKVEVDAAKYICHYNTKQQTPEIKVYDKNTKDVIPAENYKVTYGNNVNAGSGYVYVEFKGNYTGTAREIFYIDKYDISQMTLVFTEGENGVIENVAESRFPYSPLFNLVGTDDYGEEFEIRYANSNFKKDLIVPDSSKVKRPGKGSFTVSGTGTGNLYGTTQAYDYEVYGRLSDSNVSVKAPVYTGTKKDPEVTVTFAGEKLVLDEDYSLRIIPFDQTATGGGNVVVEGIGYFDGSVYKQYGEAGKVSTLELRGYSQQYVYSGSFAGPSESALYAADKDGNVIIPADKLACTFTSSVDKTACVSAGATVTITSKATLDDGSVVDGPSGTYKIVARDISSCDVKQLSSDNYTGKPLTPPISVSYDRKTYSGTVVTGHDVMALVSGRDYSLSYSNNVNPGTAVVTVTGKGNYTGSKRFMFTIKVADMATVTAKQSSGSTIVTWTARPHVTGYRVLYNTNGMTKVETTGTTVTLKDAIPTTVGVQAIVKDSNGKVTYGTPKYVAVTK